MLTGQNSQVVQAIFLFFFIFALFPFQNYNSVTHTLEVLPQTMQMGRDVTFSTMVDVSLFPEAPAAP
jgi:hypothetical protein